MAQRIQTICGIEIGKETISVAQYSPENRAVTGLAIQPVQTSGKQFWNNLPEDLKRVAGSMKLAGQEVVCAIPAEHAIVKTITLDHGDADANETLKWELEQQIINPIDEFVYDFEQVPGIRADDASRYLAVACRGETVHQVGAVLKTAKIIPAVLDLDIFAAVNVFEANYQEMVSTPAIIVVGGATYTKLVAALDGYLFDYEVVSHGQGPGESAVYAAELVKQIERFTAINGSLMQNSVPVLVTGALFADEHYSVDVLNTVPNARLLFPFKTIGCTAISEEDQLKHASQLAIAVGCALRGVPRGPQ